MILACDPGLNGAFALMDGGSCTIQDMPTYTRTVRGKKRQTLYEAAVIELIQRAALLGAETLVIEQVGGVQGQSASAAFAFGYGVGVIVTAARLSDMAIERVAATVWKKALRCPSDKKEARARASELMPQWSHYWPKVGHDGRAEAAMIGLWWLNRV